MSEAKRMARNAGLLSAARVVSLGLNFVVWIRIARVLSPEGYGEIGFGLALVSYFVLVVALGIDAVGTREVARDLGRFSDWVADVTSLRLALAVGAVGLYGAVLVLLPHALPYKVVLAALGAQIVARATKLDWAFVAVERVGVIAVREIVTSVLLLAGVLAFVRQPSDVIVAAIVVGAVPLLATAVDWAVYWRDYGRVRLRGRRENWRAVLRPALPLAASALMIEIYTNMDRLMLEAYRPTSDVGLYTAAYKVATFGLLPTAIIYAVLFPALSAALGDPAAMRSRARDYARALFAFGAPVTLAAPLLAGPVIEFLYGAPYLPASPALVLLLANVGVMHLNMSIGMPLMAWNFQTPYMWTVVAGAVANVILNVLLIPPYGLEGAASATLASEAVVFVALVWLYRRKVGPTPLGLLPRALAAALVGAVPGAAWAAYSGWHVLLGIGLSAAGYGAAAWAFGVVDRSWILALLKRPSGDPQ